MRKTIKIIGIGSRRSGISTKTNKGYDFTPISIAFQDADTNGHKAETVNVNTADLPGGISVGMELDAVMHYSQNRLYVDAIL